MLWLVVLLVAISHAQAQLTAQSSVAVELRECYLNGTLLDRNNLPPTTIGVLIDIIRKIEDNPSINVDLRQLATLILHTYRQDGIEYHPSDTTNVQSSLVLPYAPTFHSYYRHKILLTKIIPNNLQVLSNETISPEMKCALHHMLSTTIDAKLRGDESSCNSLSQYRALRRSRSLIKPSINDVEILDISTLKKANENGKMRLSNPDFEYFGSKSGKIVLGESTCPILDGVINTPWGAVSAGNLIAGIASGAQLQTIALSEIAKGTIVGYTSTDVQQYVTSIYPATLSGDLAEAVLIQSTEQSSTSITVGTSGGWNSTQAKKHFMIQSRVNVEMTDPEVRGGLDGFLLGSTITSVLSTYSSISLSQLLDMYYSPRNGIFNTELRACNRHTLSQSYINSDTLAAETYAFAVALDSNMPLRGTITSGLSSLVSSAVTNFQSYFSSNFNDMTCTTTETSIEDFRLKTNLYLVVDASWPYTTIYPAISYLLDAIEVGKFGSSVTLLNAFDGSIVVNKTFSPADFHVQYTQSKHNSMFSGVNLQTVYTNIRDLFWNQLELEKTTNYVGGNATVLLFLLNTGNLQNNEQVLELARSVNNTIPDLRVLFATSTNQYNTLWELVRDMYNDIFTISLSSNGLNVDTTMSTVLERIKSVGRRISNPVCGNSTWNTEELSGTKSFADFVEPGYINYYTISSNYFYNSVDDRKIFISRTGTVLGAIVVCYSRTVPQPSISVSNTTDNIIFCQTLTSTGSLEISLKDACDGYWTINSCPPYYISVQSQLGTVSATNAICTDNSVCRFPYDIRIQVQVEQLGCYSGTGNIAASFALILAGFAMVILRL